MDNHNSYQHNNNMYAPYPPEPEGPPMDRLKHSGPGIASFVIGLVSIVGYILIFFIAAMALNDSIGILTPLQAEELALHPAVLLASLSILVCLILNLAGVILGIIGLVLSNRKKVFAIVGTILNGIMILIFAGLIIVGMFMTVV
ncbi:hypothetical protein C0Q44_13570 [Paenibacillus sp. PCH8]|uniref:hypothetical protein n=1 Tax=Paenibacillus sp. PCH8 TaxID=2066524 RepID=UPI000CF85C28|nr:hypothetical protein [Paenibacillus sp. PCH8]PQP82466.1 hypothetical protein C0Q44_13570 [Paenibacillus sp. PCH8]